MNQLWKSRCTVAASLRSRPTSRPLKVTSGRAFTNSTQLSAKSLSDDVDQFSKYTTGSQANPRVLEAIYGNFPDSASDQAPMSKTRAEYLRDNSHHLHIFAHKHNTHVTFTRPNYNPMISLSAGNLSFRKANRGTYDAAYQLISYSLNRIQEQGWMTDVRSVEVIFRGYGVGREAVTKVLLGTEGRNIRPYITRVTDATRLKFGGTRSEKPRRLG